MIITTYQFNCFGEVTEWGAYVQLGRSNNTCVYIPTFQVWRPVGDGVYELVGENAYPAINLTQGSDIGMAAITPVYFQPGDVIGYYMDSTCNSSECGVRLDVNSSQHEVYYGPRVLNATFNITENMQLASNLAPILHIAVGKLNTYSGIVRYYEQGHFPSFILPLENSLVTIDHTYNERSHYEKS